MTIIYRIGDHTTTSEIDDHGVSFYKGFAVFFDDAGTAYRIPGSDVIYIGQPRRGNTYDAGREG